MLKKETTKYCEWNKAGARDSAHVLFPTFWSTSTKISEESSAFETAWHSAGSRVDYAVLTSTIRGPRPLACFSLSSGNSGGTGGVETSIAAGPLCTIGATGDCTKLDVLHRWRWSAAMNA